MLLLQVQQWGRNLFWVGGTGNWSSEANWSLSSGGAGGECIPTVNDNVRFDANSGAATYTATVDVNAFCKNLDFTGTNAMNFSTLNAIISLEVSANLTFVANVTTTGFTGLMNFTSNSGVASPYNITSLGKTLGAVQFSAGLTGSPSWQLPVGSPLNVTNDIFFFGGTLTTNNLAISCGSFSANGGGDIGRILNLGSSAVTVTGSGATVADFSGNTANFVLNSGTSTWTFTGTANINITTGSFTKTLPNFVFSVTTGSITSTTTAAATRTITYGSILVSSAAASFDSQDISAPSTKIYSSTVTFNNPITANFDGNSTFNGNVSFPSNSTISFNHNVTTAAAAAFVVANAAAATTLTFAGNNSFAGTLSLGNNTTTNFNGATTQAFTNTITVGTTSNVTFANTITSCSFGNDVTLGAGTTWRFSSNAATTTTMAATRRLISLGTCSSRVIVRSTVNGVAARLNFSTAQTWGNINVGDINASFGAAVTVGTLSPTNPDLLNNTNVTFSGALTGRSLFWVGKNNPSGATNTLWSTEANWSLTSNGAGGECIPTINDNVTFDANSFSATINTVTVDVVNAFAKTMTWTAATNTPTFAAGGTNVDLTLGGNLTMATAAMNNNFNTLINFTVSTLAPVANPKTVTSNGKTFVCNFNFNNVGDTWKFQDTFLTTLDVTLTSGTLSTVATGNQARNFTARRFNSNPAGDLARTLELATAASTGTTVFTITGNTATVMDLRSAANNMTLNALNGANLSTIAFAASNPIAGGTYTVETGTAKAFANFNFTHTAAVTATVNTSATGTNSFTTMTVANLGAVTFTGASNKTIATALTVNTPNGSKWFCNEWKYYGKWNSYFC